MRVIFISLGGSKIGLPFHAILQITRTYREKSLKSFRDLPTLSLSPAGLATIGEGEPILICMAALKTIRIY